MVGARLAGAIEERKEENESLEGTNEDLEEEMQEEDWWRRGIRANERPIETLRS